MLQLEQATLEDQELLTSAAFEAYKMWGYSDAELNAMESNLTIDATNFASGLLCKCLLGDEFIGFFELIAKGDFVELEQLCILPNYARKGYGKQVMGEVKAIAKELGFKYIQAHTDPNANAFMEQIGGAVSYTVPTATENVEMNVYHIPVVDQAWENLPTVGLVVVKDNKLLLAYSTHKEAWYLPGGKIDAGEDAKEALVREVKEELAIGLDADRLEYLAHIVAPAFGEKLNVLMQQECFLYELEGELVKATNEIGAVKYFEYEDYLQEQELVPGVLMVFDSLKEEGLII